MAKKTLHRTVVSFVVLSDEPLEDNISLSDIEYETTDGQWIMGDKKLKKTELVGKVAVNEVYKLGSDPDFFFMDEDGNEVEQDDD